MAVRTRAGLFDVSHMGEIEIAGGDALKAVQHITSNDAAKLSVGQIQYSALTTPQGTFVDDVLVYKLADEHFMLVVNASNIIKDFHWIAEHIGEQGDAVAVNTSSRYALIALQGPAANDVLQIADWRESRGASNTTGLRPAKWLAYAARSRGPATRAKTVLKCSSLRHQPSACGMRFSRLARMPGWFQRALAHAIRSDSRRPCGSTATTWTKRRPSSRPI